MTDPVLCVIRERGPKRPDETMDEYARRIVAGAPPFSEDTVAALVRLLRPGRSSRDGGAGDQG